MWFYPPAPPFYQLTCDRSQLEASVGVFLQTKHRLMPLLSLSWMGWTLAKEGSQWCNRNCGERTEKQSKTRRHDTQKSSVSLHPSYVFVCVCVILVWHNELLAFLSGAVLRSSVFIGRCLTRWACHRNGIAVQEQCQHCSGSSIELQICISHKSAQGITTLLLSK